MAALAGQSAAGTILHNRSAVEKWHSANQTLVEMTNELLEAADELALSTVTANAPREQVYIGTRQLMLLERLRAQSLEARFVAGEDVVKAVDRLGRDATLLTKVSEGLRKGDAQLKLTRLGNEALRDSGREQAIKMNGLASVVSQVMDSAPDAFKARESQADLDERLERLRTLLAALQDQLQGGRTD